jgi:hypothetical protein
VKPQKTYPAIFWTVAIVGVVGLAVVFSARYYSDTVVCRVSSQQESYKPLLRYGLGFISLSILIFFAFSKHLPTIGISSEGVCLKTFGGERQLQWPDVFVSQGATYFIISELGVYSFYLWTLREKNEVISLLKFYEWDSDFFRNKFASCARTSSSAQGEISTPRSWVREIAFVSLTLVFLYWVRFLPPPFQLGTILFLLVATNRAGVLGTWTTLDESGVHFFWPMRSRSWSDVKNWRLLGDKLVLVFKSFNVSISLSRRRNPKALVELVNRSIGPSKDVRYF